MILPSQVLRRASDDELGGHYAHHANNPRVRRQVERELERRDQRDRRRQAAAGHRAARSMERESEVESFYLAAEAATKGNMVNSAGRRRGWSDRQLLLRAPAATVRRNGTPELLAFLERHPRPGSGRTKRARDQSTLTYYRGLY